jgi:hypothetical protein
VRVQPGLCVEQVLVFRTELVPASAVERALSLGKEARFGI